MLDKLLERLKSGSDIRGIAMRTDGASVLELTNDVISKILFAFVEWLTEKNDLKRSSLTIAIGHDPRISADRIKNVCINTLRGIGVNVCDCSLCSTPAMYLATSVLSCSAAIEITASHHPKNRNGLKFFTVDGGITSVELEDILNRVQNYVSDVPDRKGHVRSINLMQYYCEKLKELICSGVTNAPNKHQPLEGVKIVVDAGNGAGGFFVNEVLNSLGADTHGSAYLEPDGEFPNHIPNPEDPQALESIINLTKASNADLGIIFDTDVDRVAFVSKSGSPISGEKLIALASSMVLENAPDAIVVTDSVTSDNLKEFIRKRGGMQFRYKRGYNNVIAMAKKINAKGENCPLAIESSGHAAFKENNFIDDGAYLAAKVIIELVNLKQVGKTLDDVIKNLVTAKEKVTVRIPINSEDVFEYTEKVLDSIKSRTHFNRHMKIDETNIEGVRVNIPEKSCKGWFIIRKSVHDPELVLHAESEISGGLKDVLELVKSSLQSFGELDLSGF